MPPTLFPSESYAARFRRLRGCPTLGARISIATGGTYPCWISFVQLNEIIAEAAKSRAA
jgi:hypothetical protein